MQQYFNDAQLYPLYLSPRDLVCEMGRGTGKGLIDAVRMLQCFQQMPGCCMGFVSPSYKRCLTNTLPSLLVHLERWGYKRDIHYTVGKKPWKSLGWKSPIFTPNSWDNCIGFYNGSVCQIISQDREGASNGLSLDHILIDEAKFVDYEKLKNETFQTNRGNEMYFSKCHLHHGLTITCDTAVTKRGSWWMGYEQKMDKELIEAIEALVYERWKAAQQPQPDEKRIKQLDSQLFTLRRHALLYIRRPSIYNLAVLGEDFIRRMKRELPPLTFATSIMCQHFTQMRDGFYSSLDERANLYSAAIDTPLESVATPSKATKGTATCATDSDLQADRPIIIAMDANDNINWLVAGQLGDDGRLRILKSFFVKYERKIPQLLDDFVAYYKPHPTKRVIFYFDSTFKGQGFGLQRNSDFHTFIAQHLQAHQWHVQKAYIGAPMHHIEKCHLINRMFTGRARHQILINRDNNPDLLISIQTAGVYGNRKDKRGEKLAETENDKLEGRTDGSDAFDTLCIGVERFPVAALQATQSFATSFYS